MVEFAVPEARVPGGRGLPTPASTLLLLLVRCAGSSFGLPVASILEIMRPLPVEAVPGAPAFLAGLAIIRGAATPVASMRAMLGAEPAPASRFVLLRTGTRRVALAVDTVTGLARIPETDLASAPPLVGRIASGALDSVAALDGALLLILETGRLLDDLPQAAFQPEAR